MTRLEGWAWILVVVLLIVAGIYAGMTQKSGQGPKGGAPKSNELGARAAPASAPATSPDGASQRTRGGGSPTIKGFDAATQPNPAGGSDGGTLSFGPGGNAGGDAKTLFSQSANSQRQEEFALVSTAGSAAGGPASGGSRGTGSFRMPEFGFSSGGFAGAIPSSIGGNGSPVVVANAILATETGPSAPTGPSPITGPTPLPAPGIKIDLCK